MAGVGAILAGSAYVRLYADSSEYVRGLKAAEAKLKAFGDTVGNIGRRMTALATAAAAPIAISARTFATFQDQMLAVQTVSGATGDEFKRLYDQAKALGAATSFTAVEVGGAQLNLARQGFSPAEIEASVAAILNLARATGTDLAQSADIAAGTLRAFNLDASEMPRVADVMVATANASAQTLEDLGESMKYAAPIAYEYGLSLEQTSKALGVLANMQIKGSMAGTSLRQIMLALADPEIQSKLQSIGASALDTAGNLRPIGDVMIEIGQAMAGMSQPERITLAKELFDQRAVGAALKLANSDFPALSAAIDNATGKAQEAADAMDSGLGGAFRILMSAVEGLQISIGESLAAELVRAGKSIQEYVNEVMEWVNANHETVVSIAKTIVAIAEIGVPLVAAAGVIRGFAFVLGTAAMALKALSVSATFFAANPAVLMAAALTTLGVALYKSTQYTAQLSSKMADLTKENDKARQGDQRRLAALEKLAAKQKLTSAETEYAKKIIGELESKYGDLGMSIDATTGALTGFANAHSKVNKLLKEAAIKDVKAEMLELQANVSELTKAMQRDMELAFGSIDLSRLDEAGKEALRRHQELINAEMAKLKAAQARHRALVTGDTEAVSAAEPVPPAGMPGGPPAIGSSPEEAAAYNERIAADIRRMRLEAIEDDYQREIALINEKYDTEEKRAKELGADLDLLAEARQEALAEAAKKRNRDEVAEMVKESTRRAESQQDIEDQIARQNIENMFAAQLPGDRANAAELDIERQKALVEQDRKEALREAEAIGLDPEQVNKLYDMRLARIDIEAASAAMRDVRAPTGSFSAQAAVLSGLGGPGEDKTVRATKAVQDEIRTSNKTLANIDRKIGGRMAP